MEIECLDKFGPLLQKDKRVKILVGGRGSTKSTFVADYVLSCMAKGQLWCCAREYQNSIEESVHRLLFDEVERLNFAGFSKDNTHIFHHSGGRNFYRGLARNIESLKSMLSGVDGLWIEEGQTLSAKTLNVLTPSVRVSAKKAMQVLAGAKVKMPEIWITLNRGSSADPIAEKWLARAETALERCGYYEDDMVMIVEANYNDLPKSWFVASGLEQERLDDFNNLPRALYDHKWLGKYLDSIDNAIILPEWFDAAVDAHLKLGFKPLGKKIAAFDPSDEGDPKGLVVRHGSVILIAEEYEHGDCNDGLEWALNLAIEENVDLFNWDCDGLGVALKEKVSSTLEGKKIDWAMFKGSESPDRPDEYYGGDGQDETKRRKNKMVFRNKRAQYYAYLRDRFYKTWRAVERKEYIDPEELISISSEVKHLKKMKSEVCRLPRKYNQNGFFQVMSKPEMRKPPYSLPSPNISDSGMMSLFTGEEDIGPVKMPGSTLSHAGIGGGRFSSFGL